MSESIVGLLSTRVNTPRDIAARMKVRIRQILPYVSVDSCHFAGLPILRVSSDAAFCPSHRLLNIVHSIRERCQSDRKPLISGAKVRDEAR